MSINPLDTEKIPSVKQFYILGTIIQLKYMVIMLKKPLMKQ